MIKTKISIRKNGKIFDVVPEFFEGVVVGEFCVIGEADPELPEFVVPDIVPGIVPGVEDGGKFAKQFSGKWSEFSLKPKTLWQSYLDRR